ncbi:MAG TPA: TonB-dependent receptor [Bryobacteraceae bacterium]|jgi:hypothetical protein
MEQLTLFAMLKKLKKLGVAALLSLTAVAALYAQSITTGDIAGVVKDQTGAVVPRSTVKLRDLDKGTERSYTSGDAGEYRFATLPPGRYQISASGGGLKSDTGTVVISVGQVATLDLLVKPEASQELVTVTDTVPLINSENGNLATTFDQHQLENLPAPGNDMTAYAFTAPGVTISTGGGYGDFSAFGLPGVSNLFTINGADNMDPYLNLNNSGASNLTLGSNEISEAAVVLNGYTGQYGRQAGANVNYVTKSGSNEFHGNAGWWYNEKVLNANDWFNNASGTARPFAVSNQWADSIGGPIVKNKLFFFINNEGLRYVLPGGGPIYTPTPAFSKFVLGSVASTNPSVVPFYTKALGLYNNSSGAGRLQGLTSGEDSKLGCGDIVGGTSAGAIAAQAAGFGTTLPCAGTFRSAVNNLNTEWLLQARVDYNVTNNDRIYFRYNTDHGVQATGTDAINSAFNANSVQPSYGGQFGYTRVIGSNMVNQLNLSASYYTAIFGPPDLKAALNTFPTTIIFQDGAPYTNLGGGGNQGGGDNTFPQGRKVRQWGLVDDYSINHGAHTIKFGANVRRNWVATYAYGTNTSGTLTFNSMSDFLNGSLSAAGGSTYAQAFASVGAENLSMYSAGFYVQDEWKIRPNFTITMAVRFDRNSNITCGVGCFTELNGQPFAQVAHSATTPYNASIQTGLKSAFPNVESIVPAPRVGFAYSATSRTVIRGGFGVFSDLYQGLIADRLITNAPSVASFTTTSGAAAPGVANSAFANVSNSYNAFYGGFAGGATVGQLSAAVPGFTHPNFNTLANKVYNPKYYEWNFEVQQAFSSKYMLSLNYVGNSGYQELNSTLLGNAYSKTGVAGLPTSAPDSRFGEIRELNNNGFSNYNGLVSSFRWRATSSFSGLVSYTWSHAIDTCSNACLEPFNALTDVSVRYQLSPFSLRSLNYGSADYDIRHSLSANYVWNLPGNHLQNSILKTVLGGWTAAGTFYYHSGYPFSVVDTNVRGAQNITNASGIATQPILADYLGGLTSTSCSTPNVACFNTAAFASAATQTNFGNLARNSFRGPGYFNTDLNVNKIFTVHERYKLLVGANFYNILNHPNFDLPVNNLAQGNFGTITNTVSPPTSAYGSFIGSAVSGRVIQTQVKFTF